MSKGPENFLDTLLKIERAKYLEQCKEKGGSSKGFVTYVLTSVDADRYKIESLADAATLAWQSQPRKRGPDLFLFSGISIPDILTRPAHSYISGEDLANEDQEKFEKVSSNFATVNDLIDDATIKMRKAAQSSAAAEERMKAADVARRRAKGRLTAHLRDLADKKDSTA